ncbi:MAG TPA: RcnB family protein [Luteibacter sp.]|jgi:Ni/Co efflux regulator RcnB|nr:RcnB family protein [Luteibacter sp.]
MRTVRTVLASLALGLAAVVALPAAAAPRDDHDHDRNGHDRGHDNRRGDYRHDNRGHDNRGWHDDRRHGYYRPAPRPYYGHGPGYGYGHGHWVRGHRYYGRSYVVGNYGYYRLRPPPYGYHWVRADNDFLLVAVATGVILDIASN